MADHGYARGRLDLPFVGISTFGKRPYVSDWDAIEAGLKTEAADYMADICDLADREAADWAAHPCFGTSGAAFRPADASFRHAYADFGA